MHHVLCIALQRCITKLVMGVAPKRLHTLASGHRRPLPTSDATRRCESPLVHIQRPLQHDTMCTCD